MTGKPAIHIATNVFRDAPSPIEFRQLEFFANLELTKKALSSPREFETILPALTETFLSENPDSRVYTYETCPDKIARSVEEKRFAAIRMGFDFKANDRLQDLKIEDVDESTLKSSDDSAAAPA